MTLSITGRCPRTGRLGSAMCSDSFRWTYLPSLQASLEPAGLSVVVAGLGAVTAQASSPPTLTTGLIASLRETSSAERTLGDVLARSDEGHRALYQIAVVDANGGAAAFTGERTLTWSGHATGEGWVAAGNRLAGAGVVDALAKTFVSSSELELDERLLAALAAGVTAGGDRQGHRGAALRVSGGSYVSSLDIRVHEHSDPIGELRRLLAAFQNETGIEPLAIRAFECTRAYVAQAELQALAGAGVMDACSRIREALVERGAPAEAVSAMEELIQALERAPDVAQFKFGDAMMLLSHFGGGEG